MKKNTWTIPRKRRLSFLLGVLDVSWLFYILLLLLYLVGAWRKLYPLCCVLCIIVYILNNSYLNYMCLFHQNGNYHHSLRSVVDSVLFAFVVVLLFLLVFFTYLFYWLFFRAGFLLDSMSLIMCYLSLQQHQLMRLLFLCLCLITKNYGSVCLLFFSCGCLNWLIG